MADTSKKINKQFAIIGLGRFGKNMALSLHKMGHEVLAVDKNMKKVQDFSETVTHVVQADATDEAALNELGIKNFDVVVVAIADDTQANTMATLQLKEIGVPYIVSVARDPLHAKLLDKIGADRVVQPERDMANRVAYNLTTTSVMDYIELSPEFSIVEIPVPKQFYNKTLIEANLRSIYGINIVAIRRQEQLIISPHPQEVFKEDDVIILVGSNESIQRLEDVK